MTTYDDDNRYHSFNDLPAHVFFGISEWCEHGVLHRSNDKPAVVGIGGHKEWWVHGRRHRDVGPAIIRSNGVVSWYKDGVHLNTF